MRRYTVFEHNEELPYRRGWTGLGRLLPYSAPGQGRTLLWLRSPGMAFFDDEGSGMARVLAERMPEARRLGLSPGLAVEGILSRTGANVEVPRHLPPAAGRDEAQRVLDEANEVLRAAGLAREMPEEEVPEEFRRPEGVESVQVLGYAVDEPVGEWLRALAEQALGKRRRGGPGGGASRRRARGKRRGKGRV